MKTFEDARTHAAELRKMANIKQMLVFPQDTGRIINECADMLEEFGARIDTLQTPVRCKDCAHYMPEPMGDVMMCYGFANGHWTAPEDFCSCGVRKE